MLSCQHPPILLIIRLLLACWIGAIPLAPLAATECPRIARPHDAGAGLEDGQVYEGIRMLASLRLQKIRCRSVPVRELSSLAWSADSGILYALSDRGYLFHLRPVFRNGQLVDIDVITALPLRGPDDQPLPAGDRDSEGLAILQGGNGAAHDDTLLVSFEGRPRISRYTAHGLWLADEPLPAPLNDVSAYRSPNLALESVAVHTRAGILTAPERPLRGAATTSFPIYDSNGIVFELMPSDREYGAITDLEPAADGGLLVLERIFSGVFGIIAAVIHHIEPDRGKQKTLVRFDRGAGHFIDNFEGLAHHQHNRYFMISDDNDFPLQQTLLFYFELLDDQTNGQSPTATTSPAAGASVRPDCRAACDNRVAR